MDFYKYLRYAQLMDSHNDFNDNRNNDHKYLNLKFESENVKYRC